MKFRSNQRMHPGSEWRRLNGSGLAVVELMVRIFIVCTHWSIIGILGSQADEHKDLTLHENGQAVFNF